MGIETPSYEANNNFDKKSLKKLEQELILQNTKKQKELLKNNISQKLINELTSSSWYKVYHNDILSLINKLTTKWNHIKFNNEWDKIWPGDIIKISNWKVFRIHNWIHTIVWIVTEWFKKTDQTTSKIIISKANEKKPNKTISTSKNPPNNPPSDNTKTSIDKKISIKPKNITKNIETPPKEIWEQQYIIKKWKTYLIWPDWKYTLVKETLTPKEKEELEQFKKLDILYKILDIWKTEAHKIVEWLYWKDYRDDDNIINKQIKNITSLFNKIFQKVQQWEDITNDINEIFKDIQTAEDQEDIIWSSDMADVKKLFFNILNKKNVSSKDIIPIYNKMTYGWLSWNSETIKDLISNHLLSNDKRFEDIKNILNNKNTIQYISNWNIGKLTKLLGNKELAQNIIDSYNKIKINQNKQVEDYQKLVAKLNAKRPKDKQINVNDYINANVQISTLILLKNTLIRAKIEKMPNRWNENSTYTWLYANITWLAEDKWIDDLFVISDDNIDSATEIAGTLLITAVSFWVWTLVEAWVMWAIDATTIAIRTARWIDVAVDATEAASWATRMEKIYSTATWIWKWAGTSTIRWTSFYEWSTITQNLIFWKNWFSSWDDNIANWKEIFKTIAFMWVLKASWNIMEKFASKYKIKPNATVPKYMLTSKKIAEVAIQAWLISGTSYWIDYIFDGKKDWSWAEYAQAIVMVWLLRKSEKLEKKISKINFSKNDNWNISIKLSFSKIKNKIFNTVSEVRSKFLNKTETEYFQHKTTWKQYYKKNWKFYTIDWKLASKSLKPENLEKIKTQTSKKEQTISRTTLSKYEEKIFNSKFIEKFKDNKTQTLKNEKWESITIQKKSNWEYTFNNGNKLYSKKEMLSHIDESYKINELNELNYDSILKIWEGKTIIIWKKFWIPYTWKMEILENGEIKINWKIIKDKAKIKKIISEPKIREEILKKGLDKITINDILKQISEQKWMDKLKWLSKWALKIWLERIKTIAATWLFWGITSVIFYELWEHKKAEKISDRFINLLIAFSEWAALWILFSWIWTWWKILLTTLKWTWKVIAIPIKWTYNIVSKHKKITALSALWLWTAYYLTEDEQKKLVKNNTQK